MLVDMVLTHSIFIEFWLGLGLEIKQVYPENFDFEIYLFKFNFLVFSIT